MDVLCQYRAPAPCPRGYKYYADATMLQHGMPSCVKVFPPATRDVAAATCGSDVAEVVPPPLVAAVSPANAYSHLARFYRLNGTAGTALTSLVLTLAAINNITGPLFWTDALVLGDVPQWSVPNQPFDANVRGQAPLTSEEYVLHLT